MYDCIVIIGYGVVAGKVIETVFMNKEKYGYEMEYIEHEVYPFNLAKKFALRNKIKNYTITEKKVLHQHFDELAKKYKLLIISASNNYIFPKDVLGNNITVVNFHNALLPEFPGRNAPSWAIYTKKNITGSTWHYVNEEVDAGNIIIQKKCRIHNNMKAYELAAELMELAANSFQDSFESIYLDNARCFKQSIGRDRKIYKSDEIPGNGRFGMDDDPEYIYRLLRAMDYGKNLIFPNPYTMYNGKKIFIKRYKLVDNIRKDESKIYIPYKESKYLMLKFAEEI